jgi:serine/threonine protein kinase
MADYVLNGRYRLEEKVGEGGMATTWRGHDTLLHRPVAVKILREQYSSDTQFVDKFRREAQIAAKLTHENIAGVYDTGEAQGISYIVMEFINGMDLKAKLRRDGACTVHDGLIMGMQAASAIDAAHRAGLVHRDIKPHNILVNFDGKIKITDFGIAKATTDTDDTGVIMGSVHYISPEQARGEQTTPASDIYSLGAVLYECFTGQTVFDGENALAVAHKQIYDQPKPMRMLKPDLPANVDNLVMKCLAKDPKERFHTAAELRFAIQQVLNVADTDKTVIINRQSMPDPTDATVVLGRKSDSTPPQVTAPPPRRKPETKNGGMSAGVIVLLVIVLMGVVGYGVHLLSSTGVLGPQPPITSQTLKVPAIVGANVNDAKSALINIKLSPIEKSIDSDKPAGEVIKVEPLPGTEVAPASVVTLWVSNGPVMLTVPAVNGMSLDAAKRELKKANIKKIKVSSEFSSEVSQGNVVRLSPAEGSPVKEDQFVVIILSSGSGSKTFEYKSSVSISEILEDQSATDSVYIRIEKQLSGQAADVLFDGVVNNGDQIPPQTFDILPGEKGVVRLLGGKDETSDMKTYEEKPFSSSVKAASKPPAPVSTPGNSN